MAARGIFQQTLSRLLFAIARSTVIRRRVELERFILLMRKQMSNFSVVRLLVTYQTIILIGRQPFRNIASLA